MMIDCEWWGSFMGAMLPMFYVMGAFAIVWFASLMRALIQRVHSRSQNDNP